MECLVQNLWDIYLNGGGIIADWLGGSGEGTCHCYPRQHQVTSGSAQIPISIGRALAGREAVIVTIDQH